MGRVFRADVVGSLLRPDHLKRAREQWRAGTLPTAGFKRIEDRAVDECIALQEALGLDVVTDGELRREVFADHVFKELTGLSDLPSPPMYFHDVATGEQTEVRLPVSVTGKLGRKRMISSEEYAYARARARSPLKVTISSPLILNYIWSPEHSAAAYDDPYQMFRDGTRIIREEVEELAALGCTYIQVDAPELIQVMADDAQRQRWRAAGLDPEWVVPEGVRLINSVAAPIPGVTFALHVCRANAPGLWLARGGYERFAEQVFPLADNFDGYLLEYDDERSGDFEALRSLPDGAFATLGLVSTKRPRVEDPDEIAGRITEAARYVDLDRLALSTQCGFASMEAGNPVGAAAQAAKLTVVTEVARRVWG